MSENKTVHVFSGKFKNNDEATKFSEPAYSDDGDSCNCDLWDEIGFRTDGDFIETIYGNARFDYLKTMLFNNNIVGQLLNKEIQNNNTLILIYGFERNARFNPGNVYKNLQYLGSFPSTLK